MRYIFLLLFFVHTTVYAQKNASIPFEKWISLQSSFAPVISPDGKTVIYSVNSTDWANNSYDIEIWMKREGDTPIQLTRTVKGSSNMARFTPDSKYVSFVADRGNKSQLYIISIYGGEALQITQEEEGINDYRWRPDGKQVAFVKTAADSPKEKATKERFGGFSIEGEEYKQQHLWVANFHIDSILLAGQYPCYTKKDSSATKPAIPCIKLPSGQRLTQGDFSVNGFDWSPDGKKIIFNQQVNPLILSDISSNIVWIDVSDKKTDTLVQHPTGDYFSSWQPDGKAFLYYSSVDDSTTNYYKNNRLFIYDMITRKSREIATDIDESKSAAEWTQQGIFLRAFDRNKQKVYSVDPKTGSSKVIPISLDLVNGVSFSKNTGKVAISGRNYEDLQEIYIADNLQQPLKKISNSTQQIAGWNTPVNELISWKSKDGVTISGVLLKPRNYDANKKYPLLVLIHGGPTAIDLPDPTPTYVYPAMQWIEKGALVLRVNYRGSAGYGEQFRSLNVGNLGVGDMWDVVSGVAYLQQKGMIDTSRMGCMGWSQGGYISAFLTTNTHLFKAISVGAGISNWVTYYVNTDITPFTRQYLKATPWSDMNIYLKTSPMTNINNASTPTLIQHGEFDRRVPVPNAYELYRGLQDRHIPSQLVIYKGFGHGISKPKERLAAVWHNWLWFNKYVFGETDEAMPAE